MPHPEITLLVHNIRSTHNVGAIFRTAEGFGIYKIVLSGYSPYPDLSLNTKAPSCALIEGEVCHNDPRLPHIREKLTAQIHKTALGAENLVPFAYYEDLSDWLNLNQSEENLPIVALEQSKNSIMLSEFQPPEKFALLLGEEVNGITSELLSQCDSVIEIPMFGQKESFNVSVAAGIALYGLNWGKNYFNLTHCSPSRS